MSEPAKPPIIDRSPLVRLFRWTFSRRGLRCFLIVGAWALTIIALVYGEENWRGRRAWTKERQKLEARGEKADMQAFIPPPVPEDQNFAAIPLVKSWFVQKTGSGWTDDYSKAASKVRSKMKRDKGNRHFVDLVAWEGALNSVRSGDGQENFESEDRDLEARRKAAASVLEGLKSSELDELREASRRPYARYPIVYDLDNPWGILLPHLARIKGACQRLQIRASAELASGQSDKALEDLKLMVYLTDSIKEEWFLISYLVRVACIQIALQPIWEGLAEHHWSDTQLQELQNLLQRYDWLRDMHRPLHGERAGGILTADLVYRRKLPLKELIDIPSSAEAFGANTLATVLERIAPRGWYYQEQASYCRLFDLQSQGTFDSAKKRIFPAQVAINDQAFEKAMAGGRLGKTLSAVVHHHLVASLLLPSLKNVPRRVAVAQTAVDQATLACALERFRLANKEFPQKLDALVPQFIKQLPRDMLTGEPYKYSRGEDGQFVLYSIGWNEKDDHARPGKVLYDDRDGDWVWQYPARQ